MEVGRTRPIRRTLPQCLKGRAKISNNMIQKTNTSGGAAGAGGFNFQAAITAIAYVHSLRGTPVQWTEGLTASPPVGILSETGGTGDDISLELADRSTVEVQVKKGLRATKAFWSVIDSLRDQLRPVHLRNSDCLSVFQQHHSPRFCQRHKKNRREKL